MTEKETISSDSEDYYASILEATFDTGLLVDSTGRVLYMNSIGQKWLGGAESNSNSSSPCCCIHDWILFGSSPEASEDRWKQMKNEASTRTSRSVGGSSCEEWTVSAKAVAAGGEFVPAILKLTQVKDDHDLWLIFMRPKDEEHTTNNNNRAQEIVEAALDPMFQINQDGTILMVNRAALTCFGYNRYELLGANISIICGGEHAAQHDQYIQNYLKTSVSKVMGKYRELPAIRKDGTELLIRLAVVELDTTTTSTSSPNNDDKQQKDRLFCGFVHNLTPERRNEDIIFGTIDTSRDPVFHMNQNGIIKNANIAAVEQLGWSLEELLGQNVNMIMPAKYASKHDDYVRRYLETGEMRAMGKRRKVYALCKDGTEIPIEVKLSEIPLSHGGSGERLFCAIFYSPFTFSS